MAKQKNLNLKEIIYKQLKELYKETPDIQIIETKYGKIVNINYSDFKICIDRIYNLINESMQVFVRLPHCDIHFSDLEELFDIVYKSNIEFFKYENKERTKNANNSNNSKNEIRKNHKKPNKTTEPKVHRVCLDS